MRSLVAPVAAVAPDMLTKIWDKFDYRLDMCNASRGGHIEEHIVCKTFYIQPWSLKFTSGFYVQCLKQ